MTYSRNSRASSIIFDRLGNGEVQVVAKTSKPGPLQLSHGIYDVTAAICSKANLFILCKIPGFQC